MTPKKRVHDLAKEYGLSNQDLVARLKALGFDIKSHMTALDDSLELTIRGKLEGYGIVGSSSSSETKIDAGGGLVVRKKKKAPAPEEAVEAAAPAPAAAALVESEPAPAVAPASEAAHAPVAQGASAAPEAIAPVAPVAAAPAAPARPSRTVPPPPAREPEAPAVPEAPPEPIVELAPAPPTPSEVPALAASAQPSAPAAVPPAPVEAPAPTAARASEPAAPVEAAASEPGAKAEGATEADIVRPGSKRRPGTVVGFIDLSKLQPSGPRRPEGRRLKSSDEEPAPDVKPTMGGGQKRGVVRADAARGQLTQQQLREREQGRFLRKKSAPMPNAPGQSGGPRRPSQVSRDASGASPHSGNAVTIEAPVTTKKLADTLAIKPNDLLKAAFRNLGFGAVNINSLLDDDTAVLLAAEFQVDLKVRHEVAAEEQLMRNLDQKRSEVGKEEHVLRAPCVAILGHVDHGKTTLIDTIRESKIAAGESGGITQHIGAYQVRTLKGHTLTIIDTPGHAAFTAMRARGAKAVDIVVLVVAADDGVMPQTIEALEHARAAKVPIVVAINKIDKPEANPERVKNQLAQHNLIPEEWGGTTAMMGVSGLKGAGVQELLERVFLESEVLELHAHAEGPARGVVLEAEIQQGKGRVAHLLVQDGCLKRGDFILAGEGYGKVKSIHSDRGGDLEDAGPSTPVEVTGLNELPNVGDHFHVVDSLDKAREVAEERARKNRQMSLAERRQISNENILQAVAEQDKKVVNVILKADVQGSLEVLRQQLGTLTHPEVDLKLLLSGVGLVSESDVDLAITSEAIILAFHVGTNGKARTNAERHGIQIRYYEVIYELLDEVKAMMEGTLSPEITEQLTGHTEVRAIFKSSKFGNIAGCFVLDGSISRSDRLRVLRNGRVVFSGEVGSLRREKDDAREVREGFECGVTVTNFDAFELGDVIESFKLVEVKRLLKI